MPTQITTFATAALLATSAVAQNLPTDLPPADELVERAMHAAGGRDALVSIDIVGFKAEMMLENEVSAYLDCIVTPKGRGHYKGSVMEGQVTFEFGFDGNVAWISEAGSDWRLQQGKDAAGLQFLIFNQFLILRLDEWFESRETLERAKFKGHDAYRVRFEDEDHEMLAEGESLFGWFDAKTGLLIGVADEAEMSSGIAFEDYKSAGPIKVARTVRIEIGGYMMVKVSDVTIDEADPIRLDPPAEVQKLIDAAADDDDGS